MKRVLIFCGVVFVVSLFAISAMAGCSSCASSSASTSAPVVVAPAYQYAVPVYTSGYGSWGGNVRTYSYAETGTVVDRPRLLRRWFLGFRRTGGCR